MHSNYGTYTLLIKFHQLTGSSPNKFVLIYGYVNKIYRRLVRFMGILERHKSAKDRFRKYHYNGNYLSIDSQTPQPFRKGHKQSASNFLSQLSNHLSFHIIPFSVICFSTSFSVYLLYSFPHLTCKFSWSVSHSPFRPCDQTIFVYYLLFHFSLTHPSTHSTSPDPVLFGPAIPRVSPPAFFRHIISSNNSHDSLPFDEC